MNLKITSVGGVGAVLLRSESLLGDSRLLGPTVRFANGGNRSWGSLLDAPLLGQQHLLLLQQLLRRSTGASARHYRPLHLRRRVPKQPKEKPYKCFSWLCSNPCSFISLFCVLLSSLSPIISPLVCLICNQKKNQPKHNWWITVGWVAKCKWDGDLDGWG